jgi:hypothetical protein
LNVYYLHVYDIYLFLHSVVWFSVLLTLLVIIEGRSYAFNVSSVYEFWMWQRRVSYYCGWFYYWPLHREIGLYCCGWFYYWPLHREIGLYCCGWFYYWPLHREIGSYCCGWFYYRPLHKEIGSYCCSWLYYRPLHWEIGSYFVVDYIIDHYTEK